MILLIMGILVVIIWVMLYPATDYWNRWLSRAVLKKDQSNHWKLEGNPPIYLTFDDGPNPEITPQILNVLAKYHVPATFFLVGFRAERSPELVKEILSRGHEIGVHTYDHCHAYGMFINKSINTVRRGAGILEAIIEKPIVWFRPPWGALNFFEFLTVKYLRLKVVLWTANAVDWDIRTTSSQIVERLKKKLQPGCIIVIHDAGGDLGAPLHTLEALPEFIKQARTAGYRFCTLTDIQKN